MKEKLEQILSEICEHTTQRISQIKTSEECQALRVLMLGKSGRITELLKEMKSVPPDQKQTIGALINEKKIFVEKLINNREQELKAEELNVRLLNEKIDVTLDKPGRERGSLHPLSHSLIKIQEVLTGLGYSQVEGPEIEYDKNNFELLNMPKNHPARDMQDSLYMTENILLRTQTSSAQPRAMQVLKPPFKVFSPGRCFRRDEYDATHSPVFGQVEGLVVDTKVSMADLKAELTSIIRKLLGDEIEIRFRSSYFPFTEPSVEVDITCSICKGKGCPGCKNKGGYELLGAGIVNPKVLEMNGIDSKKYSGYAFGFGHERMTNSMYKIPHIMLLYGHDVRFLKQFK